MHREWKSILGGAALAAVLILPTLAHGQQQPAIAQSHAAAAELATAHAQVSAAETRAETVRSQGQRWVRVAAADSGWVTRPRQSFSVRKVHFDSVIGSIKVDVRDGGPVTLDVAGTKRAVDGLSTHVKDGTLSIEGSPAKSISVWDWRKWFDFSDAKRSQRYKLALHLTVPRGTDLSVDDFIGDATIGDTMGNLDFEATATKTKVGRIKSAKVSLEGSGRMDMAQIAGPLRIEIDGSGKVNTSDVQSLHAELNGSGSASVGAVHGPLNLEIAGSGNLTATKVTGPVHIDIAGAGSVKIADGVADPFHVEIAGAGDVFFGGLAVNPHIEAFGAGKVRLHAIRGKLNSEGMANVKIGD